jgi:hypothetical protein
MPGRREFRACSLSQVRRGEDGAVLLLALFVMTGVSLMLVALVSLAGNDLHTTSLLRSQRSTEYAADGATTAAIQNVRYQFQAYNGAPASCTPATANGSFIVNGVAMTVTCSGEFGGNANPPACDPVAAPNIPCVTRLIDFFACIQATCSANNDILRAQVAFDDYAAPGVPFACDSSLGTKTCGTGMEIMSWVVDPANH